MAPLIRKYHHWFYNFITYIFLWEFTTCQEKIGWLLMYPCSGLRNLGIYGYEESLRSKERRYSRPNVKYI